MNGAVEKNIAPSITMQRKGKEKAKKETTGGVP